jgi:hypothetical protein
MRPALALALTLLAVLLILTLSGVLAVTLN